MEVSPAPESAPLLETPQSQPMTATASSSSQPGLLENGDLNPSGPYGTRSRNRTGGVRPNYAEDKDLDFDLEDTAKYARTNPKRSGSTAAMTAAPTVDSNVVSEANSVRSGFSSINMSAPSANEKASEQHLTGSSTTSAHAPAPSKKRKHPGGNHHHHSGANSPWTAASAPRAKAGAQHQPRAYVETNTMSFERCGAKLNAKNELVADDGTALAANGTSSMSSSRLDPPVLTLLRSCLLCL